MTKSRMKAKENSVQVRKGSDWYYIKVEDLTINDERVRDILKNNEAVINRLGEAVRDNQKEISNLKEDNAKLRYEIIKLKEKLEDITEFSVLEE